MTRFRSDETAAVPLSFDLERIIRYGAAEIAKGVDFPTYLARMAVVLPTVFIGQAADADEAEHGRRVVGILARDVWKHCPHPAHAYATAPLPAVARDAPCHCGSGLKYAQCCAPIEANMPTIAINWLVHFIEQLPRARWKDLADSRIGIEMMVDLALTWQNAGRHKDNVALLEPWFTDDRHLRQPFDPLQDLLIEAWTQLGKRQRKNDLIERAIANGDGASRSSALQRKATMLADTGDFARAWDLFRDAQRAAPDDPSLSHLEVVLLMSSGREAEARERARFWIARIARRNEPRLQGLIDMLSAVVSQGGIAMVDFAGKTDPLFARYLAQWKAAPAIACLYVLEPRDGSAGPLQPQPALAAVLRAWGAVFPTADQVASGPRDGTHWSQADAWLSVLEREPTLWNSFEVLDGLVRAVLELPVPDAGTHLAIPLLERADVLLREVLRAQHAEGLRLEWGWLENRPALTMLGQLAASSEGDEPDDASLERMQWLVDTLNPGDEQGLRFELMRTYLLRGRLDDAIRLWERFPDDFAAMRYDGALALYAVGRVEEAAAQLKVAARTYPNVLKYLLADDPKPAYGDGRGVRIGSAEEAWNYREGHLALWQRLDALEWARETTRKKTRASRK